MTPEELKAQLAAEADKVINELVKQYSVGQSQTLREIEQVALKAGMQIKEAVLVELVEASPPGPAVSECAKCGGKLKNKGRRAKWVLTQAGAVRIERDYYHCEQCGTGFFPQG